MNPNLEQRRRFPDDTADLAYQIAQKLASLQAELEQQQAILDSIVGDGSQQEISTDKA